MRANTFKFNSVSGEDRAKERAASCEDDRSADPMEDTSLQAALSLFMSTQGVS